jgi:hypothetical protein
MCRKEEKEEAVDIYCWATWGKLPFGPSLNIEGIKLGNFLITEH